MPAAGWLINLNFAGSLVSVETPSYVESVEPWIYTTENGTLVGVKLLVRMRAVSGTVYARLWNITTSSAVPGSEISTNESSLTTVISNLITAITLGHHYRVEVGYGAGGSGKWKHVRIVTFKV